MRKIVVGTVALVIAAMAAPVAAQPGGDPDPVQVGEVTTLVGAHSRRFTVEVTAPATVDLTPTARADGQVLPAALSVAGGSGFRGFLLTEPGGLDGLAALAVQLPEPDEDADGGAIHGVGWGQSAAGAACSRCEVPAGVYDLYLLAGGHAFSDGPAEEAEVSMGLEGAAGALTLTATDGAPAMIWQHSGQELTSSGDGPTIGGGGWWGTWSWLSAERTGLLVSQMAVSFTGRSLPPVLTDAEFCHQIGDDSDCETDTNVLSDHRSGRLGVTPFTLPPESFVGVDMAWDVVGDADYRAINNVLFVDLGRFPVFATGPPEEEPQPGTVFTLW